MVMVLALDARDGECPDCLQTWLMLRKASNFFPSRRGVL